jgi:hypothetical protein
MKETKYRVYDQKNYFQQTYDASLKGAFSWARDCAKRVNGYVLEVVIEDGKELKSEKVLDLSAAK